MERFYELLRQTEARVYGVMVQNTFAGKTTLTRKTIGLSANAGIYN